MHVIMQPVINKLNIVKVKRNTLHIMHRRLLVIEMINSSGINNNSYIALLAARTLHSTFDAK